MHRGQLLAMDAYGNGEFHTFTYALDNHLTMSQSHTLKRSDEEDLVANESEKLEITFF